jgi:hypothetical protein
VGTKSELNARTPKVNRERKMGEWTWAERKPPAKTPSSQDQVCSGEQWGCEKTSCKFEHTIIGKTATEKVRNTQVQTGSYKKAVVGIKMAIIHRRLSEVKLDQTHVDMIQAKLLTAVDTNPSGQTPPQVLHSNSNRVYSGSHLLMKLLSLG